MKLKLTESSDGAIYAPALERIRVVIEDLKEHLSSLKIETTFENVGQYILAKATVHIAFNTEAFRIGTGHKLVPLHEENGFEMAETIAIGRALRNIGICDFENEKFKDSDEQ